MMSTIGVSTVRFDAANLTTGFMMLSNPVDRADLVYGQPGTSSAPIAGRRSSREYCWLPQSDRPVKRAGSVVKRST
jgi:hypothetical protein